MNSAYLLCLLCGALVCSGLFAWRLQTRKLQPAIALLTLPAAVLLAAGFSKGLYFLAKLPEQIDHYGLSGLLRTRPAEFSFVGGCIGVVLAVCISALVLHKQVWTVLDAFAPCGALMAAIVRMCEGVLDPMSMVGLGDFVADAAWQHFPVAVQNSMLYSWFYAVFMLEGILALAVSVAGFIITRHKAYPPGRVALQTALFLALPQIFCERMLNQCTKWGFVRVEQVLCAVIVFGIILRGCIRAKWFLPVILDLLCVAVLVWMEFTLDNKLLLGIEFAPLTCYLIQIVTLLCMAVLAQLAFRKEDKEEENAI